jgi:predicted acylesterase/phospholipase RssA
VALNTINQPLRQLINQLTIQSITNVFSDQFDGIFELYPTTMKKLYVVDGGLTFNSPYPLLLRPQRQVDIILSFDFSARPTDDTPPFKVRLDERSLI